MDPSSSFIPQAHLKRKLSSSSTCQDDQPAQKKFTTRSSRDHTYKWVLQSSLLNNRHGQETNSIWVSPDGYLNLIHNNAGTPDAGYEYSKIKLTNPPTLNVDYTVPVPALHTDFLRRMACNSTNSTWPSAFSIAVTAPIQVSEKLLSNLPGHDLTLRSHVHEGKIYTHSTARCSLTITDISKGTVTLMVNNRRIIGASCVFGDTFWVFAEDAFMAIDMVTSKTYYECSMHIKGECGTPKFATPFGDKILLADDMNLCVFDPRTFEYTKIRVDNSLRLRRGLYLFTHAFDEKNGILYAMENHLGVSRIHTIDLSAPELTSPFHALLKHASPDVCISITTQDEETGDFTTQDIYSHKFILEQSHMYRCMLNGRFADGHLAKDPVLVTKGVKHHISVNDLEFDIVDAFVKILYGTFDMRDTDLDLLELVKLLDQHHLPDLIFKFIKDVVRLRCDYDPTEIHEYINGGIVSLPEKCHHAAMLAYGYEHLPSERSLRGAIELVDGQNLIIREMILKIPEYNSWWDQ